MDHLEGLTPRKKSYNAHECALDLALEHSNRAVALDGQSPMAQAVQWWTLLDKGDGPGAEERGKNYLG
jgi:hypothetical protein